MSSLVAPLVIVIALAGIFAVFVLFVGNYRKAEPNEALIFTGRKYKKKIVDSEGNVRVVTRGWRAVVGGAALRIPILEKVGHISLELINLTDVRVEKAYSKEGVPVTIDAVANVKVSGEEDMLARAVERFLSASSDQIKLIIKETLEGQLRDIIGVMTVEQLYQERQMFVDKVLDQAGEELSKIGVIIDIINIQDIRDERGYLEALGVRRTAEVKRDAAIGEAKAMRDAMRESETARREGEVVKAEQERQVAEAQKERDVATEQYRGETFAATSRADQQGPLFEARARQEVVTEQQRVKEREQEARKAVEAARAAAEEQRYRAEMVVPAEASRQAAILKAEGEAAAILKIKEAEAKGIKLVLQAEADGLKEKAQAWEMYGEAAKLNLALEALKVVAEKGADALGGIKFDKVVAIDGGAGEGGGSVARMMTAAPKALVTFIEQVKAATGVDLTALVPRLLEEKKSDPASPAKPSPPEGGKAKG